MSANTLQLSPCRGCPSGKSCLVPGRPCSWSSPHLLTHRCESMKVWPSQPNSGHLLRSIPVAELPVPPLPQGPPQAHCVINSLQARLHRRGCFPGHVTCSTNFPVKVDAGPHLPRHAGMQAGKVRTPGIFCPMLLGPPLLPGPTAFYNDGAQGSGPTLLWSCSSCRHFRPHFPGAVGIHTY